MLQAAANQGQLDANVEIYYVIFSGCVIIIFQVLRKIWPSQPLLWIHIRATLYIKCLCEKQIWSVNAVVGFSCLVPL